MDTTPTRAQHLHGSDLTGRYKALMALMLLGPGTPMLFQGQAFAASSPFFYCADCAGELALGIRQGRVKSLSQFPSLAQPEMQTSRIDPVDPATFARSKLDLSEWERHAGMYALHRDVLRLRREDPVFRAQRRGGMDGAVLTPEAFVLRFCGTPHPDRLLVVNLGRDFALTPAPEPLLAPPEGMRWEILWSSEDPRYGGSGTAPLEAEEGWHMPGQAAVVLRRGAGAGVEQPGPERSCWPRR
jgi:maltooligosyltrehalose trehalohydrolase